jgi:hypothetical protein
MNVWEQKYKLKIVFTKILRRIEQLLGGDAAYACTVISQNKRRSDAGKRFL